MADYGPFNKPILDATTQTNSGAADVIADSGELARRGNYEAWVIVGCTVNAKFAIARRNAANGADVGDVVTLRVLANSTSEFRVRYTLEDLERIVVRTPAAITGDLDVALVVEKLA